MSTARKRNQRREIVGSAINIIPCFTGDEQNRLAMRKMQLGIPLLNRVALTSLRLSNFYKRNRGSEAPIAEAVVGFDRNTSPWSWTTGQQWGDRSSIFSLRDAQNGSTSKIDPVAQICSALACACALRCTASVERLTPDFDGQGHVC